MNNNNPILPESVFTPNEQKILLSGLVLNRLKNTLELLFTQITDPEVNKSFAAELGALLEKYFSKLSPELSKDITATLDELDKKTLLSLLNKILPSLEAAKRADLEKFIQSLN